MSAETTDTQQISKPPELILAETPKDTTYRVRDSWNLGSNFSPAGASMSNAARVQEILRNRTRRANHLPGHILSTYVREGSELTQGRTVCPCQKCDPRDPSRSDPTSRPSRTAQDRMCAAQGIQFHHSILPCKWQIDNPRAILRQLPHKA